MIYTITGTITNMDYIKQTVDIHVDVRDEDGNIVELKDVPLRETDELFIDSKVEARTQHEEVAV